MKKKLCILLTLTIILISLFSCNTTNDDEDEWSNNPPTTTKPTTGKGTKTEEEPSDSKPEDSQKDDAKLRVHISENGQDYYHNYYSQSETFSEIDFGTVGIEQFYKAATSSFDLSIEATYNYSTQSYPTIKLTANPPIIITGKDADQFIITQPSEREIDRWSIRDSNIEFKPTSPGEKTARITIPNTSSNSPNFSFTIKGKGSNWIKFINNANYTDSIITDKNNNVFFAFIDTQRNIPIVRKYNSDGIELWETKFVWVTDSSSYIDTSAIDSSNNYLIAGSFGIVKLNENGEKLWQINERPYNLSHNSFFSNDSFGHGNKILFDRNDGFFEGGRKYNSEGQLQFTLANGRNCYSFDSLYNIIQLTETNLIKTSSDGKQQYWTIDTGIPNVVSMCIDSSDNIYVAGYDRNKAAYDSLEDIIIKKFDPNGNELTSGWAKIIDQGQSLNERPGRIQFDGENIILETIESTNKSKSILYCFSVDGTSIFSITSTEPLSLIAKDKYGLYFIYKGYNNTINSTSLYIEKYDSNGNLVTSIKNSGGIISYAEQITVDSFFNIYTAGSWVSDVTLNKYSSDLILQ